jgi:hypothetical protein
MGTFLAVSEQMARLHHLLAGFMDRRFLVMDRANESIVLRPLGHSWKVLADPDAGYVGRDRPERPADGVRSVGLQIPGIELAGSANKKEEDTVDILAGVSGVQIGQRQTDGPGAESADAQKVTPRQAVTGLCSLAAFKLHHGRTSALSQGGIPGASPDMVLATGLPANGKPRGAPTFTAQAGIHCKL